MVEQSAESEAPDKSLDLDGFARHVCGLCTVARSEINKMVQGKTEPPLYHNRTPWQIELWEQSGTIRAHITTDGNWL